MKKNTLIVTFFIIAVLWLLMMTRLFQRDVSKMTSDTSQASSGLFHASSMLPFDSWMEIFYKGQKLGYTHTALTSFDREGESLFALSHRTELQLVVLEHQQKVVIQGMSYLDAEGRLKDFVFYVQSKKYDMKVSGNLKNNRLSLQATSEGFDKSFVLDVPDHLLFAEDVNYVLSQTDLKAGDRREFVVFDPMSMAHEPVVCDVHGLDEDGLKIEMNYQGLQSFIWLDEEGSIIKEVNPMGWIIMASTREKALSQGSQDFDILESVVVGTNQDIANPRLVRDLQLILRHMDASLLDCPEYQSQSWVVENDHIRMMLQTLSEKDIMLSQDQDVPIDQKKWARYLAHELFIQSDDPLIQKKAQEIVGNAGNAWDKAKRINQWLYKHLDKQPVISVPSAVDVLHMMRGDCNEHTILFTALARAVDLPSIPCVGLVMQDQKFYYHVWPLVYVGRWVAMDPSLGQDIADATHIGIVTGGMERQARIASLVGKLEIEILEYK